jgi:hypothetical protein
MQGQSLEQIRQGLKRHHGSFQKLAERTGYSHDMVRGVLQGRRRNPNIILEAAKLWRELESERTAALNEAQKIAAQAAELAI